VVRNVKDVPAGTWVSTVEAGRHAKGTAFVTFDGHRTGDMRTYVYRTDDYGQTWKPIMGTGLEGYLHVVRQDLVNQQLLFAGSEFGLFVSVDAGAHWARLAGNLPAVAVYDIAIHPRDHDAILATHGRGIQILDDITPLRALTLETLAKTAMILPARPSEQTIAPTLQDFPGDADFAAGNPPDGAVITYYLKERHVFGKLELEVLDPAGKVIKTLPAGARQGINRVYWNMRLDAPKSAAAPGLGARALAGPMVPEGKYTVRLTRGDEAVTGTIELRPDSFTRHPTEDRRRRQALIMQLYDMQNELAYLGDATSSLRDQAKQRGANADARLKASLDEYARAADALNETLVDRSGGLLEADPKLREKVIDLYGSAMSYGGAPTPSQAEYAQMLSDEIAKARTTFGELSMTRLQALNADLAKAGAKPIAAPERPKPGS